MFMYVCMRVYVCKYITPYISHIYFMLYINVLLYSMNWPLYICIRMCTYSIYYYISSPIYRSIFLLYLFFPHDIWLHIFYLFLHNCI